MGLGMTISTSTFEAGKIQIEFEEKETIVMNVKLQEWRLKRELKSKAVIVPRVRSQDLGDDSNIKITDTSGMRLGFSIGELFSVFM